MNKTDLISSEKIETPFSELNRSQFVTGSPKHQIHIPGPTHLLNRALQCFRVLYAASAR